MTAGASVVLAMIVKAILAAGGGIVTRVVDVELRHHLGRRRSALVLHDVATPCLTGVAAHWEHLTISHLVRPAIIAVRDGAHTGMPAAGVRVGGRHYRTIIADCLHAL